jgi:hypothetical protein
MRTIYNIDIYTDLEMTSYEDRKRLFENIKMLVKPEQEEVFRLIKKTKENYTENSNGIFFDLSSISDEAIQNIHEYINFCLKTRQEHECRLKELETIRIQNEHYLNEDDITSSSTNSKIDTKNLNN